ncbi:MULTISPECIES: tRNA (guanosine(37)-N1)-methyltransferase TrmD [Campylobacter]|uniref:tRNA (guanine-N(1)-)-methyltransferase n=1 Tax=Campylobacter porcelli TaxID=1660073 RepID=A0ABU7M5R5_9BACT|nr:MULTISPECIES: tRNA (guanosine(37)-N1)-methyltransferase TrmD [unclassified Campylobacter]MCR8679217.1 tRNA (guanosine(37)-N1)-methyltransferase TrmD [Campylobacter sp. RM19072]MEE3744755.1 tRNA (guanosine(37)-N1)-methyltransferase TrmD [Campylobacter sp. CX2-4855-23]
MKFNFITLFPNLITPYFSDSILGKAVKNGIIEINCINPRNYTKQKHNKVDEYMIGGGAGLLMSAQPLCDTIDTLGDTHIIYLTPAGKKFNQNDAKRLSKLKNITFICGRYEGIDERVVESRVNEVFCIGDFILTGGELAAMSLCDAISRNIYGVLGNFNSLNIESFEGGVLEAPSFTKPNIFNGLLAPSAFLKGNHSIIFALKNHMALCKTRFFRPDLYQTLKSPKL